jgi:hypothetical protein
MRTILFITLMSNFEQTAAVNGRKGSLSLRKSRKHKTAVVVQERVMPEADQFREYAREALQWASQSTTEKEKRALLELSRTWWQAALESGELSNCFGEVRPRSPVATQGTIAAARAMFRRYVARKFQAPSLGANRI